MNYSVLSESQRISATASLQQCHLFSHMSKKAQQDVLTHSRFVEMQDAETLFEQNAIAAEFFLLCSGQVKLNRLSNNGQEKIVEFISPGETFAEAVIFSDQPVYPVNAISLMPSQVLCIESEQFLKHLRDSTSACFALMAELSRRLHMQLSEIDHLSLHSATARLASFLIHAAAQNQESPATVDLCFPKVVLASRLSITPETLSRVFKRMRTEGLISIDNRKICVLDPEGLKSLLRAN